MLQPDTPHLAFPFSRSPSGVINVVEQDSVEHIMACEQVIARCPLGYRDERPEFGWPWPDLRLMPLDPTPLINALNQFEPRAAAISVPDANALANAALGVDVINVNIPIASRDGTGSAQEDD